MKPSAAADTAGPPPDAPAVWPGPLALAVSLLVALAALFAAGVLVLAAGARLSAWLVAPALIAGALAGAAVPGGWRWPRVVRAALLAVTLVALAAAALGAASRFHDVSWDGQVYHQPAVLALADGWNPLWDGPLPVDDRPDNLWVNHYPKAAWVVQAILLRASGSLEATKGVQLLALLAAGLAVFAALGQSRRAALAAALAAANPVAVVQSFSFYVDGMSASLMTGFVALAWGWLRRPGLASGLGAAAALVLLVNLKFTGPIYAGVLVAGAGAGPDALVAATLARVRGAVGRGAAGGDRGAGLSPLRQQHPVPGPPLPPGRRRRGGGLSPHPAGARVSRSQSPGAPGGGPAGPIQQ